MTVSESKEEAPRQGSPTDAKTSTSGWWKPVALIGLIVALFVLSKVFGLGDRLGALRDWIGGLGAWGPAVFVLLYVAGTVAAVPGAAITVAAGALFGSLWGVVMVSVASTLGASLAFAIGRYFARPTVARWLSNNDKFQQLDRLTEEHGAIIVALTRLTPIFPFNLLNYGFGLTRVPFWTYVFWSWLCMLPGTVLYVVGADAVAKGLTHGRAPWGLIGAAAGAALVLTLLVRYARRILQAKETKAEVVSANVESSPHA